MSGHSKWHNIQVRKGKQDKAKSGQFTKVTRMITVAAREGGGDPQMNVALRLALDKAREVNMPKDNIERAIKRGTGDDKEGQAFEEVVYEGFGPAGVAFMVQAVTDNRNRSSADIKYIFSKHGGAIAGTGSVQWQFERKGIIRLEKQSPGEALSEDVQFALIEAGADDIQDHDHIVEVTGPVDHFTKLLDAASHTSLRVVDSGLEWIAKDIIEIDDLGVEQVTALLEELEGNDDVHMVFTNAPV